MAEPPAAPPAGSLMCECSHHWAVHAESGQTAPTAVCHGYIGNATPGPLREPCLCTGFRPWAGPWDSRTGMPVKPLTVSTAPAPPAGGPQHSYDDFLVRVDGPAPGVTDGEFGHRFTALPDSGIVELHCGSHSPMAHVWRVGYHPSLDVLVAMARAHNAAEHEAPATAGGAQEAATPGEFPPPEQVNWELLKTLYDRPHPLIRDIDTTGLHYGIVELLDEAKAVHHLLDLAGVPHGYSLDTRAIAARTLLAIMAMGNLRERLARISAWHARETGPAGTVGDYCTECGHKWPCDTSRMADGTYTDEEASDDR